MAKRRLTIRHPALIYGLLMVVAGICLLDFMLWKVDPIGLVRYHQDYAELQRHALPAPHGMVYAPGNYTFAMYRITVGLDGFRAVSASQGGDCQIVFIGDSLTWGMGSDVNFVDLLAPDIPATVRNTGIAGYNIDNIVRVVDAVPADGYIYLSFLNDGDAMLQWQLPGGYLPPALRLYLDYWKPPEPLAPDDAAGHFRAIAGALIEREDVLTFAFRDAPLADIAQRWGAYAIPMYTHQVSGFDRHPDEAGHREIADAMRESVVAFVSRICSADV